jgi:hypothetical protein
MRLPPIDGLEHAIAFFSLRSRYFSGAFWNVIVSEGTGIWECVVTEFVRKSSPRIDPSDICQASCILFFLILSLLSVTAGSRTAKAAGIQNVPALSAGSDLTIAIADFDGDRRLDSASVQPGGSESGASTYWIQFQFSASGRQLVELVAPAGGLGIEARDVNGDHVVDLIFTTAWLRQPVAILLNDGHGIFSRVEPAAFPAAFDEPGMNWVSGARLRADFVALPPQSRIGIDQADRSHLHRRYSAETLPSSASEFPVAPIPFFSAGRAPPSAVNRL